MTDDKNSKAFKEGEGNMGKDPIPPVANAIQGLSLTSAQIIQFFQLAPFAIAVLDRHLRYISVSQRWISDYRLSHRKVLGESHSDVFPSITAEWEERFRKCLAGEKFPSQESTFAQPDGKTEWIQWKMDPWKLENGEIGGVILFSEFITAQKLREIELEKNQKFLTAVLESVQDGIVACDAEGNLTLFNAATRELHGLPEEPIPAEAWADHYDLYRPDGQNRLPMEEIPLFRALSGEKVIGDEMVIAPKGREAKRVLSRGQAMFDKAGKKLGAVASMHDITAQYKAAQELKEREQQYRSLYNKTPAMLHSVNRDGILIRVSDYWLKTLGYTREEVIDRPFFKFLPEASQAYVRDHVLPDFVEHGQLDNVEFKVNKKDGTIIDVQLSAVAQRDEDGAVQSFFTVLTDVTERRRIERALRRSEEQFRKAFQTSPQGMALVSTTGRWLMANEALCEIFGYPEKELLGLGLRQLTHPEDLDSEIEDIKAMLAGELTSFQIEKRYLHKDGSTIWGLVSITLVRDENNEPAQFVFQMLDLTKRRDAETQLIQAQKLEAVGQLTGGIAHDFNNLLAVNLISLQLLERTHKDDPKSLMRIRAALDATERGADLTRRLLAFSRRQNLEQTTIDVDALIRDTRQLLKRTLGGSVKLETHTEPNLWKTKADKSQLESALINLAINARDAMPDGGDLTIETRNVDLDDDYSISHSEVKPGRYILVAVTDTGIGIPEDVLEKVFQPFFTTKDVGQGTGLGLSMVYGFVKQSEGHIEIYSEVGLGTSIKLYLPAYDGKDDEAQESVLMDYEDVVGGTETILVTEDDPDVRRSVVALCESLGYQVIEAEDGAKALNILEQDLDIDLLFSDIVMPGGMTGIGLSNKARKVRPDLKVLLTTGFAEVAVTKSEMPDVATEIIGKPYRREELARKLRGVLDAK